MEGCKYLLIDSIGVMMVMCQYEECLCEVMKKRR